MKKQISKIEAGVIAVPNNNKSNAVNLKWQECHDTYLANTYVKTKKFYGVWPILANLMKIRFPDFKCSAKQCRERWKNCLDPYVRDNKWSDEEELLILDAYEKYGSHWAEIAKEFKGRRTNDGIKNRFYTICRRVINKINKEQYYWNSNIEFYQMAYICTLFRIHFMRPNIENIYKNLYLKRLYYKIKTDFLEAFLRRIVKFGELHEIKMKLKNKKFLFESPTAIFRVYKCLPSPSADSALKSSSPDIQNDGIIFSQINGDLSEIYNIQDKFVVCNENQYETSIVFH